MKQTEKIRNELKKLITEDTSQEVTDLLSLINENLNEIDSSYSELDDKHTKLTEKYRETIMNQSFKATPRDDIESQRPKMKSFEDCVAEVMKN